MGIGFGVSEHDLHDEEHAHSNATPSPREETVVSDEDTIRDHPWNQHLPKAVIVSLFGFFMQKKTSSDLKKRRRFTGDRTSEIQGVRLFFSPVRRVRTGTRNRRSDRCGELKVDADQLGWLKRGQ